MKKPRPWQEDVMGLFVDAKKRPLEKILEMLAGWKHVNRWGLRIFVKKNCSIAEMPYGEFDCTIECRFAASDINLAFEWAETMLLADQQFRKRMQYQLDEDGNL